jgi:hypothetical protein
MQRQLDDARRKVDVDVYTITIRELLAMVDREELHRAPDYQRKFQWNEEAESRLIESILLGLPVPNIFVATNDDGRGKLSTACNECQRSSISRRLTVQNFRRFRVTAHCVLRVCAS